MGIDPGPKPGVVLLQIAGSVVAHAGRLRPDQVPDLIPAVELVALERFIIDQLTPIPGIEKIRTSFTLKQVRYKTALPLPETT